jgi:hypothetical protein
MGLAWVFWQFRNKQKYTGLRGFGFGTTESIQMNFQNKNFSWN